MSRRAPRALQNVVSEEENVRAVVAKVQVGEADAGIVYRSDVSPRLARYVKVFELPAGANVLAPYPIAVLGNASEPAAARAFVELVLSPAGQNVLARHGFIPAATRDPQPEHGTRRGERGTQGAKNG